MKFILAFLLLGLACPRAYGRTSVPEFAEICGIRVGYDTTDTLEHQMGHGSPEMGGHAHSGRRWLSTPAGCEIDTDAFYYYDYNGPEDGPVIDFISITPISPRAADRALTGENKLPEARVAPEKTRFMGVVSLGMTKDEVLRALGTRLPPPTVEKGAFVWNADGYVHIRQQDILSTSWRAQLTFQHGKLYEIRIEGD